MHAKRQYEVIVFIEKFGRGSFLGLIGPYAEGKQFYVQSVWWNGQHKRITLAIHLRKVDCIRMFH